MRYVVRRWFSLILVLSVIISWIPAADSPMVSAVPVAQSAAPPLSPESPTIPRPAAAESTGLPASAIAYLRQQYARYHTLTSVFDGEFNTVRVPTATIASATSSGSGHSESIVTLPPGAYDSAVASARMTAGFYGGDMLVEVRPAGTPTWYGITVLSHPGTNYGAPPGEVVAEQVPVTFGAIVDRTSPLEVRLSCNGYQNQPASCTWSNIQFFHDVPGWRYVRADEPRSDLMFGVYSDNIHGIVPRADHGSFLALESLHRSGGAALSARLTISSPVLQLPIFTGTDPVTVSVDWTRVLINPQSSIVEANAADVLFVPLDGSASVSLIQIPRGTATPWHRQAGDQPLPATLSGQRGRIQISMTNDLTPRVIGLDALTFYQGGRPIAVPTDQVVGKCFCDVGGSIQSLLGDPVNTFSGAFYLQATDLSLVSGGPALSFERTYVSRFANINQYPSTSLGPGWRHSFEAALTLPHQSAGAVGTIVYEAPTGNRLRFYSDAPTSPNDPHAMQDADGIFDPAPGIRATLTRASDGTYTLLSRDAASQRFDAQGRLIEQRDPQGHVQKLTYYAAPSPWAGQLQQIRDETTQRSLTLAYADHNGPRVISVADSAGRTVQYRYTSVGDLWQVIDLRGGTTTYGYDGTTHLLTTITDPAQVQQLVNTYDAQQRIEHQVDPTGETTFTYTTAGDGSQATSIMRQSGSASDVMIDHYRADGSLEYQERNGMLVGYVAYSTSFAPTVQVDGNGHATLVQADGAGRPTRVVDAAQRQTSITYRGTPTPITDSQGVPVGTAYPDPQRPVELLRASGTTTSLDYDTYDNLTHLTTTGTGSNQAPMTSYTYTADNRVEDARSSNGVVTRSEYDALKQLRQTIVGYGTALAQSTTYSYDSVGRLTTVIVAAGTADPQRTEIQYNPDGTVAEETQHYQNGIFDPDEPDTDIRTRYGYDLLGRRIWVEDVLGRTDVTHYNTAGQLDWEIRNIDQRLVDPGSLSQQLQFRTFSAAAPDRNIATLYSYDTLGRIALTTETGLLSGTFDPATRTFGNTTTRVTRTEYDQQGRPRTTTLNYQPGVTEPRSDVNLQTITLYDGADNPIWNRDTLGRWTRTEYDSLNRPVMVTRNYENGDPTTIAATNQSWGSANDTDLRTKTEYTAAGQIDRVIDNFMDGTFSRGALTEDLITWAQYDPLARVQQVIASYDPATSQTSDGTNRAQQTTYHPTTGLMLGERDALGHWTRYSYDTLSRVTSITRNCRDVTNTPTVSACAAFDPAHPDRNVTDTQHYDARGRVDERTDVTGQRTRMLFDGLDRITATIRNYQQNGAFDPAHSDVNVTTRTTYDAVGRATSQIDPLGATTSFGFDQLDRTVTVTDALGRVTQQGYEGTGTLRWSQQPGQRLTVMTVDGMGRTITAIRNYEDGLVAPQEPSDQDLISRVAYDAAGRRVQTTDPAGRVTVFRYDLLDRLIAVQENVVTTPCTTTDCNVLTQYEYDRLGNRTAVVDARGKRRMFTFDAASQPRTATDANGQQTAWTFDAGGNLLQQDVPGGSADDLQYTHDALGRLTQVQATKLPAPITTSYTAQGWRQRLTDATGDTIFSYDELGRITAVQAPQTGTVGYRYDARGQRTQVIYPGGSTLDYRYRPDGQLQDVRQGQAALADYSYDPATGQLSQVARANGTVTTYRFDRADRLQGMYTTEDDLLISSYGYTVDRLGQRNTIVERLQAPPANGTSIALQNTSTVPIVTYNPYAVASADLNGDGAYDIVTPNYGANTVSVLLSQGDGTLSAATTYAVGSSPAAVAIGDLNGDTYADLVVANAAATSSTVSVLLGHGDGSFATATSVTVGSSPRAVVLADLNHDRVLDLTVTNATAATVSVLLGQGTGAFGPATPISVGAGPQGLAARDVNRDGHVDLVVANGSSTTVSVLLGQGTGAFSPAANLSAGVAPQMVAIQDLNGDGQQDLVVLNHRTSDTTSTSGAISVLLGTGNGTFAAAQTTTAGTQPRDFGVGDLNRDGHLDVAIASTGNNTVVVLAGNGDGTWGSSTTIAVGSQPRGPVLVDLNRDGKRDLVVANSSANNNTLHVLTNQSSAPAQTTRTVTYTYDGLRRLSDVVESPGHTFSYRYDPVGNRLNTQVDGTITQQYTYDDANQIVGWNYDARGNLLNDGTTSFTYDALNRLTSQTRGSATTTNTYNGDGVLVTQQGATSATYVQDVAAPVPHILRQTQGSQTTDYLYGLERLAAAQATTRTWFGTDALGSVRQTLDERGQTLAAFNYDPWGMPEGASTPPRFGFTSELQDAASGSIYLRARWYQPNQGTFLSRDPFPGVAERPASLHPYLYVGNDPVHYQDPTGRVCLDWVWNWTGYGDQDCRLLDQSSMQPGQSFLESSLQDLNQPSRSIGEDIYRATAQVVVQMGRDGAQIVDAFAGSSNTAAIDAQQGPAAAVGTGIRTATYMVGGVMYPAVGAVFGAINVGNSAGHYLRDPGLETFGWFALDLTLFACSGGGGSGLTPMASRALALEQAVAPASTLVRVGIGARSSTITPPLYMAQTNNEIDQKIKDAKAAQKQVGDTRGLTSPHTNREYALGTIPDGSILTHSGADSRTGPAGYARGINAAERLAQQIGFEFKDFGYRTHAEIKVAGLKTHEAIGVSRPMCPECKEFFKALADATGETQVVADPKDVWIFKPGEPPSRIPNRP